LPYGVQKIVSVARALAMGPKLLLLDEPCTGLIREERENLARFLLRIRHEFGPTIIWVEHDMQMVSDLADRVVVLNHGVTIVEGLPDDVRRSPAVIEAGRAATDTAVS
jgi:branched-chain amino acid transport system ATP-binding protein